MRKTLGVAALMLAFCCPAFAGEVHIPPAPQPQSVTVQEPTTTDTDEDTTGAADTLTQIVLTVLLSVLP